MTDRILGVINFQWGTAQANTITAAIMSSFILGVTIPLTVYSGDRIVCAVGVLLSTVLGAAAVYSGRKAARLNEKLVVEATKALMRGDSYGSCTYFGTP